MEKPAAQWLGVSDWPALWGFSRTVCRRLRLCRGDGRLRSWMISADDALIEAPAPARLVWAVDFVEHEASGCVAPVICVRSGSWLGQTVRGQIAMYRSIRLRTTFAERRRRRKLDDGHATTTAAAGEGFLALIVDTRFCRFGMRLADVLSGLRCATDVGNHLSDARDVLDARGAAKP